MTNLEVINKYLYRAWRDNKLNYNLSQEMWNYTSIIPDMMHKYIENYLKAPKLQQLRYYTEPYEAISATTNVINATLSPLMLRQKKIQLKRKGLNYTCIQNFHQWMHLLRRMKL